MQNEIVTKREREKQMVSQMIALYCKKQHGGGSCDKMQSGQGRNKKVDCLCEECTALDHYARERSEKCPFMETKTFCSNCKVHCYRPEMREKIREVMRFSGPRMIFSHPVAAMRHVIETKKEKKRMERES